MIIRKLFYSFIFLLLFFTHNILSHTQNSPQISELSDNLLQTLRQKEGLVGSTLVKTGNGYSKIEDLKIGNAVLCYDAKTNRQQLSKVTYVDKINLAEHIQITINDQILQVAPEHKFWLQSSHTWITAEELAQHPEMLQQVNPQFQQVQKVNQELDVIRITVDKNHNFYITEHNILTHNFVVLEVLLTWGAAEGVELAIAASPLLIAAAHQAFCWFTGKAVKSMQPTPSNIPLSPVKQPQFYQQEIQREQDIITHVADKRSQQEQNSKGGDGAKPTQDQKPKEQEPKDNKAKESSKELGAQAPGIPTKEDGYEPPKKWDGEKVRSKNGKGYGWPDAKGNVWIPTGPGSKAHGGPHWDVQSPDGKTYDNVYPGGKIRPGKK